MENKKQQAIEKAYGDNYNSYKNHIDENGWIMWDRLNPEDRSMAFQIHNSGWEIKTGKGKEADTHCRPKSLKGFENNNGWITIESDTVIPDDADKLYFVGTMFESGFQQRGGVLTVSGLKAVIEYEKHTHFLELEKPEKPIY